MGNQFQGRWILCHQSVFEFFQTKVNSQDIAGRRLLEVGSRDVNGTVRERLTSLGCKEYIGVDIVEGPSVDRLCDVHQLVTEFGEESFDVVVTTEMLEHVRDWRRAIHNLKSVVARGGQLIITTRSFGFPYHDYPGDYWRYELDDMRTVFRDFEILELQQDHQYPGVFLKCRKPKEFHENDSTEIQLFSVVKARRTDTVDDEEVSLYAKRFTDYMEVAGALAKTLAKMDWASMESRSFRAIRRAWTTIDLQLRKLSKHDDAERADARETTLAPSRTLRTRLRTKVLDLLLALGLLKGRRLVAARASLLGRLAQEGTTALLLVPWAAINEQEFQDFIDIVNSFRKQCSEIEGGIVSNKLEQNSGDRGI